MASGVLHIRYGSESIGSKASSAVKEIDGICSSLDRIRDKIIDLPERSRSGNNLSKASSFLRKKQQEMARRQDALEVLKSRNDTFMSRVETTEKRLSSDIKHSYKEFHKETGIGKTAAALVLEALGNWWDNAKEAAKKVVSWLASSALAMIKAVGEGVKGLWDSIVEWYNENKYIINAVLSFLGCIAAVAAAVVAVVAVPGAGVFAAVVAIAKVGVAVNSLFTAVKDIKAAGLYYSGNEEAAHELSSKSTGEFIFGADNNLAKAYNLFAGACSLVTLGADLYTLGAPALSAAKNMSAGTSFGARVKEFGKVLKADFVKNLKKSMEGFGDFSKFNKENGFLKIFTTPITVGGEETAAYKAFTGITRGVDFAKLAYDSLGMLVAPSINGFGDIVGFFVGGAADNKISAAAGT